jgi:hypothetical protein
MHTSVTDPSPSPLLDRWLSFQKRNESSACSLFRLVHMRRESIVPSTAYYAKQAELCLKLAALSDKEEIKSHLITLAATHKLKAVQEMTSASRDRQGHGATAARPQH